MFWRRRPPAQEPQEVTVKPASPVKPEEVIHSGKGKVIQRVDSIEGVYKCGSTTVIHLAVRQEDGSVIAFRGTCTFAELPLAVVGDTVSFTFQRKGWIDLKSFGVDFTQRDRQAQ